MKAFRIILILTQVLIIGLDANCQSESRLVSYDLKDLPKITKVMLSDLGFVDIKYIPLESKDQSLITAIDLVFFNDYSINKLIPGDGYFLLKNGNNVLKFSEDGKFISRIGNIGRGPEEVTNIEDLDIDKENQNIYLLSGWQKKFCVYSPNGQFIRSFKVPFYIREFRFSGNYLLCYCGNNRGDNENSFILLDKMGHIIKKFPNRYSFKGKSVSGYTHENLFYSYNKKINIKELYSDTIYSFENSAFYKHGAIEVGKKKVTQKVRAESTMEQICANYIQPINLFEFGSFIFYAFTDKFVENDVRIYGFIGSKEKNYQALFNLGEGISNDLDGGPSIIPLTIKNDNTIITMLDVLTLKKYILTEEFKKSKPKYPEKKQELVKLANSLNETDNPVLVLISLK
jgi:hypothetical protein